MEADAEVTDFGAVLSSPMNFTDGVDVAFLREVIIELGQVNVETVVYADDFLAWVPTAQWRSGVCVRAHVCVSPVFR